MTVGRKNSARRQCGFAIWLTRAGFEPRPTARLGPKSHADQALRIKGAIEMYRGERLKTGAD
jgi:hypothetical protein